ncbi:hypothetical protein BD410DRAFT_784063 [Rickenella mellea]|uniref:Uncharacterized protein n=1 Tax=Rickenella mellea TaxID=50990 RepID=A0A4Y7QGQ6_9AGAM|nr:hypothetical protein BD410DRAFT_784063 [Rickenella mellea]
MAHYSYYQQQAPSWGTQQYQFASPPVPSYQPQPSWHAQDYYRAHAGNYDSSIFDYAWGKVKNFVSGGGGVRKEEARYFHRRIYGGLVDLRQMLPSDIGAAAAYEAWRNWKHHYGIYGQPLSDDRERQREALIGLAIAEASKLWSYTGRHTDRYGSMESSEAAAATASRIFRESREYGGYGYSNNYDYAPITHRRSSSSLRHRSRSRSRPRSGYYDEGTMSHGSDYGGYSRPRTRSFSGVTQPIPIQSPMMGSSYGGGGYPSSYTYGGGMSPGYAGSGYAGSAYGGGGSPYGGGFGGGFGGGGSAYGGSGSAYGGGGSAYGGYGGGGYTQQPQYASSQYGASPNAGAIVIATPGSSRLRRHSHSSHHSGHHRRRSHSRSSNRGVYVTPSLGY